MLSAACYGINRPKRASLYLLHAIIMSTSTFHLHRIFIVQEFFENSPINKPTLSTSIIYISNLNDGCPRWRACYSLAAHYIIVSMSMFAPQLWFCPFPFGNGINRLTVALPHPTSYIYSILDQAHLCISYFVLVQSCRLTHQIRFQNLINWSNVLSANSLTCSIFHSVHPISVLYLNRVTLKWCSMYASECTTQNRSPRTSLRP